MPKATFRRFEANNNKKVEQKLVKAFLLASHGELETAAKEAALVSKNTKDKNLGKLLSGMLCHVNLIPVNPTNDSEYQRSRRETIKAFQLKLGEYNVPSTVRMEKGIEVSAGCGQLAKSNLY